VTSKSHKPKRFAARPIRRVNIDRTPRAQQNASNYSLGIQMSFWVWLPVLSVGALNVALSFQAQRTALSASSWLDGFLSLQFLALFGIGCASLLALYTVYVQQVALSDRRYVAYLDILGKILVR
jgi:uncharacterized membrane protein YqgA involved in biofilm formation